MYASDDRRDVICELLCPCTWRVRFVLEDYRHELQRSLLVPNCLGFEPQLSHKSSTSFRASARRGLAGGRQSGRRSVDP
jgi:hypothetical protein